jgi:hypothetical protein
METFGRPDPAAGTGATERVLATTRVLCGALAASSGLMALVAWLVVGSLGSRPAGPPPAVPGLPLIMTAAAAVLLLLASRLRANLLRRIPARGPGAAVEPGPALAAYQRASILSYALLEAVAVLGLTLTLLTGEVRYALIFSFAAVLSILVRWPRQAEIDRLLGPSPGMTPG